ncbi:MAG TPA: hypothetical protein VLA52_09750 [Thermohalobaculum sp.]|nr:hypothetical protein [Thermohalobaculum sp.]
MREALLAYLLLLGGLGCVLAWGVCQVTAAVRRYRIGREADEIKLYLVKGGQMPEGAPVTLARDYMSIRLLGILGNLLLVSGIAVMIVAYNLIP